jgi:hypothetical protein
LIIQYKVTAITSNNIFILEERNHFTKLNESISFTWENSRLSVLNMKYKNITDTIAIKIAQKVKIFFALKYFCSAQIGLSTRNDTRFQNQRKSQTSIKLFN